MGILFKNVVKSLSNSRYVFRNSSSINPLLYIPKRHVQLDNTNNLLKKLPLVRRLHGSNDDDMHYFSLLSTENDRYFSPEKELHLPFPQIRPSPVNVVGSCNGVVCLEDKAVEGRTVLWNPSTNEFKVLPPSCIERHPSAAYIQFWSSGFGFDLNSQDYKVIRFAENVFETEEGYYARTESQVELYSLKSDSWKEIPDPNMSPWPSPSAYVNGVFYWVADAEMRPDFILSYDFANQKFSSFPFPDSGKRMGAYTLELLEWDGSLSAIIYPFYGTEKSFDLWVMNDESWSSVSIFPVPGVVGPLGFWTKDQLLVEGINHELKLFDLATRELKHLRIYDYPETLQFIPCVESNVQLNGKSEFEEVDAEIKEEKDMAKRLIPLLNHVLVEKITPPSETTAGILLPEKTSKLNSGKVVAVGPGYHDREGGKLIPVSVKEGDTVLLPEYGGTQVKLGEKEYHLYRDDDILGTLQHD